MRSSLKLSTALRTLSNPEQYKRYCAALEVPTYTNALNLHNNISWIKKKIRREPFFSSYSVPNISVVGSAVILLHTYVRKICTSIRKTWCINLLYFVCKVRIDGFKFDWIHWVLHSECMLCTLSKIWFLYLPCPYGKSIFNCWIQNFLIYCSLRKACWRYLQP